MSEQRRLMHASVNAFTRQLLEAGLRDRPRAASFDAVAAGIGLGAAGAMVSKAAALSAAESAGLNATAHAPVAGALASSAVKWLAIGVLAGGVASGGGVAVQRALREEPPSVAGARPSPHTRVPSEPRTVRLELEPRPRELAPRAPAFEAAPRQPGTGTSARRAGSSAPEANGANAGETARGGTEHTNTPENDAAQADGALTDGALAREAAWIDAARRALDQGELARATSALDDYDRERRIGVLNREALVLRVEVALRQRDFPQARALTEHLAVTYPGDPHVARLRARLAASAGQ